MKLSLQIFRHQARGTLDVILDETTTIGRKGYNRLQIDEAYVSSRHAVIKRSESGSYFLEDCGSTNGTFINDQAITGPSRIEPGDVLRFGLASCSVHPAELGNADSDQNPSIGKEVSSRPVAAVNHGNWPLYPGRSGFLPASRAPFKKSQAVRPKRESRPKKHSRSSKINAGRGLKARSYGILPSNSVSRRS